MYIIQWKRQANAFAAASGSGVPKGVLWYGPVHASELLAHAVLLPDRVCQSVPHSTLCSLLSVGEGLASSRLNAAHSLARTETCLLVTLWRCPASCDHVTMQQIPTAALDIGVACTVSHPDAEMHWRSFSRLQTFPKAIRYRCP